MSSAKTKVAFVLSGGVSAGAYIAGALDELLRAFNASDQYEIDIIVGGSAGSTTGALLAHGLLFNNGDARLYDTWVRNVDILPLLATEPDPNNQITVLNGNALETIANHAIEWSDSDKAQEGPARCCSETLRLAMSIANCTALPYASGMQVATNDGLKHFVQYRNAEQQTFEFRPGEPREVDTWNAVTTVSRASSAIPFVFPRVKLRRNPDDQLDYIMRPAQELTGEQEFWYYDGGTFNNLPIGLAGHYIEQQKRESGEEQDRLLIVVNPWDNPVKTVTAPTDPPDLLDFGLRLFGGIRNESSTIQFQMDYIAIEAKQSGDVAFAIPGVNLPPEDILGMVRMITPERTARPLCCVHLNHLSAFLDESFREYDFRRGAVDATFPLKQLGIDQIARREDATFYEPDNDPRFVGLDLTRYEQLGEIQSSNPEFKGQTVKAVFEDHLERRTDFILNSLNKKIDIPFVPEFLESAAMNVLDWKANMPKLLPKLW